MRRRIRLLLGLPTLVVRHRLITAAAAALLTVGLVLVPRPGTVRADALPETPEMSIAPDCVAPPQNPDGDQISITVSGYSFAAAQTVTLYWNGSPAPPPDDAITVNADGSWQVSVTVFEAPNQASFELQAFYAGQVSPDAQVAVAYLDSPCPSPSASITISPDCGPVGTPTQVHIDGTGFLPDLPIDVVAVDLFGDATHYGEVAPTVPADPNAVSLDMSVTVPNVGAYRIIATQRDQAQAQIFVGSPRAATGYFVAPCSAVVASPSCGAAGSAPGRYDIALSGTGFQPGLPLSFVFDPSGTPQYFYSNFQVNDDGSWGPAQIDPYMRGVNSYDIVVSQQNDSPVFHATHVTFTVECPAGTVSLDPTCAPPQLAGDPLASFTLNVSGFGFQAGFPVTVTFDPDGLSGPDYTPESAQSTADGTGAFAVTMTVAARPANTYRIAVEQQVGGSLLEGSVPPFSVPCTAASPTLTATPNCGSPAAGQPQAYAIHLVGRRFIPGQVRIVFDADGAPEEFSASAGPNGRFDATITPSGRGDGPYRIVAEQADANQTLSQASSTFVVPCSATTSPMLTVSPNTVSPGFVVQVHGTGFPPGTTVELHWNYGIGANLPITVTAGDDGSFDRQVVVFQHDFTGARQLTAGTTADPLAYPGAEADLLVVAGQGSPPQFPVFGVGSDQPGPIVVRR